MTTADSIQQTSQPLPRDAFAASRVIRLLTGVITAIVLVLWTVLGFLLWIPLLTRMIVVFTSAVISAMFTGRDPSDARNHLEVAITFYSRGFHLIRNSMSGETQKSGPFVVPHPGHMVRLLKEVAFCLLFWLGVVAFWKFFLFPARF